MNGTTMITYADAVKRLKAVKLQHTQEKLARYGYIDGDDSGMVPPPADFQWQHTPTHPDGYFYGKIGCGRNLRDMLEHHPVYIDPDNILAGRWMISCTGHGGWCPDFPYDHLKPWQERYDLVHGIGAPQHFGPDLQMGLDLGFGGLLRKVRYYHEKNRVVCPAESRQYLEEFYTAEQDVLLGIRNWVLRTARQADTMLANESDPFRKNNLRLLAEVNYRLAEHPPETFLEACQWLVWFEVTSRMYNGCGAGGHLDVLLQPYFERDLAAGYIDRDKAVYIVSCLLLADPHYYQLSGPDAVGNDTTCAMSWIILEAAELIDISCNLTVRYHDGIDREFFRYAVRCLVTHSNGWPRFCGDKGLVKGFMKQGFSSADARRRVSVGCHWMSLPGLEYTLNDCVKINTVKVFEVALQEMAALPPGELSIATLWQLFTAHLQQAVAVTAEGIDFHLAHQHENRPELWLNLLSHGPIELGRDATDGGMPYYNMCVDGSGLATVADSFTAIQQRVETEKVLSWETLLAHIAANFSGGDGERVRMLLKGSDRFGRGGAYGDRWAKNVSELFTKLVTEKLTPGGRRMVPGWFSWANTIPMGRHCGATPNGRRSGEPISHGTNPDPGFRTDGAATALLKAVAAVQCGYGNTCPVQLELDPGTARGVKAVDTVTALITAHCEMGGTLMNINILDREKLLAAHRNPEAYPDLVVRVTGFSAYFTNLSPEFRQLVVDRIISEVPA